ncbi:unnamed protein product [Symbiodinium sp. CCMP2456]|nr:unnamed protein product [Symbiodinium sp. CCMP2456]
MQPSRLDVLLSTKDMASQKGGLLSLAVVTANMIGSSAKALQRNCGFSISRIGSRSENSNPWSQPRNLDKTLFKTKGDNLMELTESCPEIFKNTQAEFSPRTPLHCTATLPVCPCFPVLSLSGSGSVLQSFVTVEEAFRGFHVAVALVAFGDLQWQKQPTQPVKAVAVGKRVKKVVHDEKVHFYVSPFQRTLQTARNMIFSAFDPYQVVAVSVDPRIREQEFGNLQGDNFVGLRQESTKIRRFWYRFPTGESGADVYDRTRQWWDSMMDRHLMEQSGASSIIVVTHGLTMRLILMQLFHWSPNTFHTVWNPDNCAMYVLQKNMSSSAHYPYFVDEAEGDRIMSSIDLVVTFQDNSTKQLTMVDYLSIPPPRTLQLPAVKELLAEQFGLDPLDIKGIDFYNGIFQRFK